MGADLRGGSCPQTRQRVYWGRNLSVSECGRRGRKGEARLELSSRHNLQTRRPSSRWEFGGEKTASESRTECVGELRERGCRGAGKRGRREGAAEEGKGRARRSEGRQRFRTVVRASSRGREGREEGRTEMEGRRRGGREEKRKGWSLKVGRQQEKKARPDVNRARTISHKHVWLLDLRVHFASSLS